MTILILNEKAFAAKYITAINNNAKMTEALAEVCTLWIDDKNSDAKEALENFFNKIKHFLWVTHHNYLVSFHYNRCF